MTFEVSVIASCLNEQDSIHQLTSRLLTEACRRGIKTQLVIVDDGSVDYTWSEALKLTTIWPSQVVCSRHATNLGIPAAWRTGLSLSTGKFIGLIDSDLQNPPEVIFDMYELLTKNAVDLVRGVRHPTRKFDFRKIMSKTLNLILNIVFEMKSKDNKSGFVLAKREVMTPLLSPRLVYHQYQTFLGVAAHSLGLAVLEMDTPFEARRFGKSFLSGRTLKIVRQTFSDIKTARIEF